MVADANTSSKRVFYWSSLRCCSRSFFIIHTPRAGDMCEASCPVGNMLKCVSYFIISTSFGVTYSYFMYTYFVGLGLHKNWIFVHVNRSVLINTSLCFIDNALQDKLVTSSIPLHTMNCLSVTCGLGRVCRHVYMVNT